MCKSQSTSFWKRNVNCNPCVKEKENKKDSYELNQVEEKEQNKK